MSDGYRIEDETVMQVEGAKVVLLEGGREAWILDDPGAWEGTGPEEWPPYVALILLGLAARTAQLSAGEARDAIREALAGAGLLDRKRARLLDPIPDEDERWPTATLGSWFGRWWPALRQSY